MIGVILREQQMEMTIQRVDLVGLEKRPPKFKTKTWRVQIKVLNEFKNINNKDEFHFLSENYTIGR